MLRWRAARPPRALTAGSRTPHAALRGTGMVPYIYLCTMIQCGRQSSRLGRASVNSTCPEAASAMPFCREHPCLLPNIRARSRGCPSRLRCTSADGDMRTSFCRRRAVRAARNGVSCKRAPIPRFGQRHRYIRETTSRVAYALSALAVVLIAQTSAKKTRKADVEMCKWLGRAFAQLGPATCRQNRPG